MEMKLLVIPLDYAREAPAMIMILDLGLYIRMMRAVLI